MTSCYMGLTVNWMQLHLFVSMETWCVVVHVLVLQWCSDWSGSVCSAAAGVVRACFCVKPGWTPVKRRENSTDLFLLRVSAFILKGDEHRRSFVRRQTTRWKLFMSADFRQNNNLYMYYCFPIFYLFIYLYYIFSCMLICTFYFI